MSTAQTASGGHEARMRAVDDHIRFEAEHDLQSLVGTFGDDPEWHNKPSNDVLHGHDSIRAFYADIFGGFPDFWLDIPHRRATPDAIYVEGWFGGTHQGMWAGIPPTGRKIRIPICAAFTFTADDKIKSEIAYYDRLTILEQLGVAPAAAPASQQP
jgi:steroid delta-isomerase-like uncharacterized protein